MNRHRLLPTHALFLAGSVAFCASAEAQSAAEPVTVLAPVVVTTTSGERFLKDALPA